ncbi:MAG: adenosylcobinamide-phosphate synthase CbiB [Pseudomonadota bacterium]
MLILPADVVLGLALLALVVDAATGEPTWLYARVPHPIVALGRLIGLLDGWLWRAGQTTSTRRRRGILVVLLVVLAAASAGAVLGWLAMQSVLGLIAAAVICSAFMAQRSLTAHVGAVAAGLERGLAEGRAAVGHIVGRDPASLDEAGVARAAVESAAENVADGVIAPLFWLLVLGPIGLVGYKAVNTLDSMLGYRSERYLHFGWAAARLDDVANHLPARLTAGLLLLAAGRPGLWPLVRREAPKHRSPNAGWPEAAAASALGVKLAGPRVYASGRVDDPFIGVGRERLDGQDVRRAVRLLWRSWAVVMVALALAWAGLVAWPFTQ